MCSAAATATIPRPCSRPFWTRHAGWSREGVDPAYVQRLRRASFGASIKSLNSFEAIASTVSEGCFQGYDPFRFPEVYDSITQQDLLDFIRDNIRPERMALSVIYPKE